MKNIQYHTLCIVNINMTGLDTCFKTIINIYRINKQIKTFSRYLREAIHYQNNSNL